jgi:hypothetical protein
VSSLSFLYMDGFYLFVLYPIHRCVWMLGWLRSSYWNRCLYWGILWWMLLGSHCLLYYLIIKLGVNYSGMGLHHLGNWVNDIIVPLERAFPARGFTASIPFQEPLLHPVSQLERGFHTSSLHELFNHEQTTQTQVLDQVLQVDILICKVIHYCNLEVQSNWFFYLDREYQDTK